MIQIIPLRGMPEIAPGCDLPALLADALARADIALRANDILVITSKIVSKTENCFIRLDDVQPSAEARALAETVKKDARLVQLVLDESSAIIRTAPNVLIVRHRLGHVMANAGIDASNIGGGSDERVLVLPKDPDASARALSEGIGAICGETPAVVISDSFGRPWRYGVVNVAVGAHGVESLIDRRGEQDRDGRVLQVTQVALADLLASASGLACGEGAEGVPAALIRGYKLTGAAKPASALIRPVHEDLFK